MSNIEDQSVSCRLLFFTAEQFPTFRPDVTALFGKYLPRHGVFSDLVTERDIGLGVDNVPEWDGGRAFLCKVPGNRAGQYLLKFWHNFSTLLTFNSEFYQAIQVRDMSLIALMGLVVAKFRGLQFFYWLSFPQSEGQIERAVARGIKGGMRFWFPLLQGYFGKWLLYKVVLPRADHVFVQSPKMLEDLAQKGISPKHMTPVLMGVDLDMIEALDIKPVQDARLIGKRVIVYLGTFDRVRKIDILFEMLTLIKQQIPNIMLLLVGDTEDVNHREWLLSEISRLGVNDNVFWTGWLSNTDAWSYLKTAEIGLSPIPRSYLLDISSPTKVIEYMALGLPVVANDNPDQYQVLTESGAGLCVPYTASTFSEAVLYLLSNHQKCQDMSKAGIRYVDKARSYNIISEALSETYHLLSK